VSTNDSPTPIPQPEVDLFLSNQFRFAVQVPSSKLAQTVNATFFPMAPPVKLSIPAYGKQYRATTTRSPGTTQSTLLG